MKLLLLLASSIFYFNASAQKFKAAPPMALATI